MHATAIKVLWVGSSATFSWLYSVFCVYSDLTRQFVARPPCSSSQLSHFENLGVGWGNDTAARGSTGNHWAGSLRGAGVVVVAGALQ